MKKLTPTEILDFHCPRWDELPSIPLYMDQVTIFLEDSIGLFSDEKERVITKTMINNYVKQRIISAPEKKKYSKKHIAMLVVLSMLKKVLSMQEVGSVLSALIKDYGPEKAYNLFCEQFESNLRNAFTGENAILVEAVPRGKKVDVILNASLCALISKLVVQSFIADDII